MTKKQGSAPTIAYLDQNIWVAMARGREMHDKRWIAAYVALKEAVSEGRIVAPLGVAHYLELWHRRDKDSREKVAALMRDISGYVTIKSPYLVRRHEVRGLVNLLVLGSSPMPMQDDLIGYGASHAFGSPHGRFRFVEKLASADGTMEEGPAVEAPDVWNELERKGPQWEWFQLAGDQEVLDNEGVERTPEHRYGTNYLNEEMLLRNKIIEDPKLQQKLWDLIVVEEFI